MLGIGCVRLVFLPLLGIAVVKCADLFALLPPADPLFRFVLLLQFAMPTAINLGKLPGGFCLQVGKGKNRDYLTTTLGYYPSDRRCSIIRNSASIPGVVAKGALEGGPEVQVSLPSVVSGVLGLFPLPFQFVLLLQFANRI